MNRTRIDERLLVAGTATGPLVISPAPLSFWGGFDAASGEVIDRRHPLSGRTLSGLVLALPWTRGSSTTTAVLLESVRRGTAPAAILLPKVDTFIALAAIVARELYGRTFPVAVVPLDALTGATRVQIDEGGVWL